jgi:hypothetical protein
MPMRAKLPMSRCVLAIDADDAIRQACLCVDRDLEEVLANVNAINVSEVIVEVHRVEPTAQADTAPWNHALFPAEVAVPSHILPCIVRGDAQL